MKKNLAILIAVVLCGGLIAHAFGHRKHGGDAIRFHVWSTQAFHEPFYNDEAVEIYLRLEERGYVTIYTVNSWGQAEIIYPRAHHRWKPLRAHRDYRLRDLARDIYLSFDGSEGTVYLGFIVTPEPTHLVPWIEEFFCDEGFHAEGYFSIEYERNFRLLLDRVKADIRFRIGSRCEASFEFIKLYVRPRPTPSRIIITDVPYCPPPPPVIVVPRYPPYPGHSGYHAPKPKHKPEVKKRPPTVRRGYETRRPSRDYEPSPLPKKKPVKIGPRQSKSQPRESTSRTRNQRAPEVRKTEQKHNSSGKSDSTKPRQSSRRERKSHR